MKSNEFLNEGPLDFAKKAWAGVTGGVAGYQAKAAELAQSDKVKRVAATALKKWAEQSQNLKMAGQPVTPEQAVAWFSKYASGYQPSVAPTDVNPRTMQTWLNQEIAGYMASKQTGAASTPAAPASTASTTPGTIGALGKRGTPPTAPTAPTTSTTATTATLPASVVNQIQIVNQEPITLRYKNKEYGLNDQGQWAPIGSNKALSQSAQALFDKVAGFAE